MGDCFSATAFAPMRWISPRVVGCPVLPVSRVRTKSVRNRFESLRDSPTAGTRGWTRRAVKASARIDPGTHAPPSTPRVAVPDPAVRTPQTRERRGRRLIASTARRVGSATRPVLQKPPRLNRGRGTMATRMTERQQLAIAMRESMASAPVVPVVPVALMDDKESSPPPTVSARHRAARRAATQKTQNTR